MSNNKETKIHIREPGISALLGLPHGAEIMEASFDATSGVISIGLTGAGLDSQKEESQPLTQRFRDLVNKDGRYVGRLEIWSAEPPLDAIEEAIANAQLNQKDFIQKLEDDGLPISALVTFEGDYVPTDALGALMGKVMAVRPSTDEVVDWVFLPPHGNCEEGRKGYVGFTLAQRVKCD